MSPFLSPVRLEALPGGSRWKLHEPLEYRTPAGEALTVPADFVTDLASVPRGLWNLFPPWDEYGPAAILHDWLYSKGERPRKAVDGIFLAAMKELGVSWWRRWAVYLGVRAGGWLAWKKHRAR